MGDKKDEGAAAKKENEVVVNINQNPERLLGQKQRSRYWYYWQPRDRTPDMVENGFYEVTDQHGQNAKVKVEKILKKSYKKTKLYHEAYAFKYLTADVLDSIYRFHENMEINIVNDTSLNLIYRLHSNKENKNFKKLCVLNVYGEQNGFLRNSTLSYSLSKHNFNISSDGSDEASQYLYTSTMVYSPN